MKEITFIFVNTQTTLAHRLAGFIINAFQHSVADFTSHLAIQFDYLSGYGPCILEATTKGVVLSDYGKYDTDSKKCTITIELTDEEYALMEKRAIEIAEHCYTYSYLACLIGGIANSISRKLAKLLATLFKSDYDDQLNCSETGADIIRTVYTDFCGQWADSELTPYDVYINMMIDSVYGIIRIKKVTRY